MIAPYRSPFPVPCSPFPVPDFRQIIIQRLAVDVVHHEERVAVVLLECANLHNVRMDKSHRHKRFVLELPVRALVTRQYRRQHLDGKMLVVKLRILRKPHRPHPAGTKLADDTKPPGEERPLRTARHRHRVVYRVGGHNMSKPHVNHRKERYWRVVNKVKRSYLNARHPFGHINDSYLDATHID